MNAACHVIRISDHPPVVRFHSGRTILEEALEEDQWLTRYWTAEGRPYAPYEIWSQPSFRLEIDGNPVEHAWTSGRMSERTDQRQGCLHHVTQLLNDAAGIRLQIHTGLDGTPIITRWLEIANISEEPKAITGIFPLTTLIWARRSYHEFPPGGIEHPFVLGRFTRSDWSYEGWFKWENLVPGRRRVKCDKGQGFDDPFLVLRNEATGEHWIGHLAWSANWIMDFDVEKVDDTHDSLRFGMGPWSEKPQRVIAPGESVGSPSIHLGCVSADLDSAVGAMHDHIRGSVLPGIPKGRANRIQYSVPADQGYPKGSETGLDERTLLDNVDLATSLEAELFIVDAGWWDIAGEWTPSAKRLPRGLDPVIERARSKGLLFGLYAELEGGRGNWEDSEIYSAHPDWFGPKNVLDLTKPEVAEYVEGQLRGLIEGHDLDLFRLDYNPLFTHEGPSTERYGQEENNYWRYYEAFYAIFGRVRKRYPDLILQQAAAGGARNDLGTAGRFHESYLTDGLRVPHVLQVYSGLTMGLPPESLVIGLGADGGPARGHPMNLETNLRTMFTLSTPWIFAGMTAPSIDQMPEESIERFRHYVRIYRDFIRPVLPGCRVYHHSPVCARGGVESEPWFAMEYASRDRGRGWATIARIGPSDTDEYVIKPRGLTRGFDYNVTLDGTQERFRIDGRGLIAQGVPVRLEQIGSSELILFHRAGDGNEIV